MKGLFVILLLGVGAMADWASHKAEYQLVFDVEEDAMRADIYYDNLNQVNQHNAKALKDGDSFFLAMNKFGHLTASEFAKMRGLLFNASAPKTGVEYAQPLNAVIPKQVDWRTKGYVTPVKNQGQCGSCWAFSTTGGLEGQHFRKTGKLVSLSEQNLVDCVTKDLGCDGGLMEDAYTYIQGNKGIDTEASYPYTAKDGKCKYSPANEGATDKGFVTIPAGSEAKLTAAIASQGPISVAIDASSTSFQFYDSGVYYDAGCSSTQLDHGVLAVGYGVEASTGKKYYLVKNSWDSDWGNQGYIWMSRDRKNNCGIATDATYPIV